MSSKGVKRFREAGLTMMHPRTGREQFYIHNNEPDPQGRRVYCIVAHDMSFNELVVMSEKEYTMFSLSKGEHYTVEDWTETFNIQPKDLEMLEGQEKYGYCTDPATYETLMQLGTG